MNTPDWSLINPQLEGSSLDWGEGELGVLLLHGLTATTAEVRPFAERLKKRGYRVVAPLLPGHGTTPEALNRTTRQQWIQTVDEAYATLAKSCRRIAVAGESAGAVLALHLASEHPELAAVVCYAPAMRLAASDWDHLRLTLASPFVPHVPKRPSDKNEMAWQGYPVNPLKAGVQLIRLQAEVRKRLPRLHHPILILQGRHDPTIQPYCSEVIRKGVGSAFCEIRWLERSGHVLLLDEEAESVLQQTEEFLGKTLKAVPPRNPAPSVGAALVDLDDEVRFRNQKESAEAAFHARA